METQNDSAERVRGLLKRVFYPGFDRNIVAAGFVTDIDVATDSVTVHFAPNTRHVGKVREMEVAIRTALADDGAFEHIEVEPHRPFADTDVLRCGGVVTPL